MTNNDKDNNKVQHEKPPYKKYVYDYNSIKPGDFISNEEISRVVGIPNPRVDVDTWEQFQLARLRFGGMITENIDFACFLRYPKDGIRVCVPEESSTVGESRLKKTFREFGRTLSTIQQLPLDQLSNSRREQHEKVLLFNSRIQELVRKEHKKQLRLNQSK